MSDEPQQPGGRLVTEEAGLRGPLENLRAVLIPQETLEAWAVQRRIFALFRRRLLVAATSGRLVWINRKLLGGFDVSNVRWQDLEDVTLRVGVFGADLAVRAGRPADLASQGVVGSRVYAFAGLRKAQAQAVYRICQAQDQAWREKRRIRELEELRARSGGIQLPSPPLTSGSPDYGAGSYGGRDAGARGNGAAANGGAAAGSRPAFGLEQGPEAFAVSAPDAARRLAEAKKLLDDRLITDAEYEAIKARILSGA